MKTNFQIWYNHYRDVLVPYYFQFCSLFEEADKPTFHQFMIHCFRNTKQNYDQNKKQWNAPVY